MKTISIKEDKVTLLINHLVENEKSYIEMVLNNTKLIGNFVEKTNDKETSIILLSILTGVLLSRIS